MVNGKGDNMIQETISHLRDRQINQVRVIDHECIDKQGNVCAEALEEIESNIVYR